MEIIHRIAIGQFKENEFYSSLQKIGVQYKTTRAISSASGGMIYFDISESDQKWEKVLKFITQYSASDICDTFFTDEEIRNAEWVRVMALENGYPQPISNWPMKQQSLEILCPKCAVYKQISNMRIRSDPKLRNKSFMSLIGNNELFCKDEVFAGLHSIGAKGYERWDTLIHRDGTPSKVISQLFIPEIASPGICFPEEYKFETCPVCGVTKYRPHLKGVINFKKESVPGDTDFFLTNEWFGSGWIAFREIIVSNRVATFILDKGWEGFRMKVISLI